MKLRLLLTVCSMLVSGCALMDTGEVEYRRAEAPPPQFEQRLADARDGNCEEVGPSAETTDHPGEPRNRAARYRRWRCIPLFPARLIRRNATVGDPIAPNEIYSIRIEHGVIAELIEDRFSFRRLLNGRDAMRRVGEVAILAHAFEFSGTAEDAGTADFRFANLSALDGVKVVYFNPDVEQGQALNFSNIPLQEGREYHGRPIGIQIIVLELDRMSGPLQSLMRTLAELGQQSASIPSGPAAAALLELGTSLISQDNDDVMFEYRFVLDRSNGGPSLSSAPFEAGRYVVRRVDERLRMQRWDDLLLDHNTGQLLQCGDTSPPPPQEPRCLPYEQDTYFTLNVIRHPAGGAFFSRPQTLSELSTELRNAADRRDAPLTALNDRLEETLLETRSRRWQVDLAEAWNAAATRYRAYGRRVFNSAAADQTCIEKQDADLQRVRGEALFEAQAATANFLSLYAQAEVAQGENDGVFDETDQRAVLATLGSFFAPFSPQVPLTSDHLVNPASFKTDFTGSNGGTLHTAARTAAELFWSPQNCREMIAAGVAQPVD